MYCILQESKEVSVIVASQSSMRGGGAPIAELPFNQVRRVAPHVLGQLVLYPALIKALQARGGSKRVGKGLVFGKR